jgi:hypothetical protein
LHSKEGVCFLFFRGYLWERSCEGFERFDFILFVIVSYATNRSLFSSWHFALDTYLLTSDCYRYGILAGRALFLFFSFLFFERKDSNLANEIGINSYYRSTSHSCVPYAVPPSHKPFLGANVIVCEKKVRPKHVFKVERAFGYGRVLTLPDRNHL